MVASAIDGAQNLATDTAKALAKVPLRLLTVSPMTFVMLNADIA